MFSCEEDTRAFFTNLGETLNGLDGEHVKARLRAVLSKIEGDPATLSARIYAIPAATGEACVVPKRYAG